jgi:GxxExxY protein
MFIDLHQLTEEIIGAAIVVQRNLGLGLPESVYQEGLCEELSLRKIPFECRLPLPLEYKGIHLASVYRVDLLVAESVVVNVKSVDRFTAVHEGQLLLDLWLGGWTVGLLINFNVAGLKIHQKVLELEE